MTSRASMSAIITAFERVELTVRSVKAIAACNPAPSEILVHVDAGRTVIADAIRRECPDVRLLISERRVGPGGARNRMIGECRFPIVASFDDDSWPMDEDYFRRAAELFARFPEAWVIGGRVYHRNESVDDAAAAPSWVADFSGGGCCYRRDRFDAVGGYVPLADAYNMEEVDFALRLHAQGGRVLGAPSLRVFHDTDLARHAAPEVTAASIANLALLAFLRYPVHLWVIGIAQCANRIQWLIRHGRRRGIVAGIADIPERLWSHRARRQPLAAAAVRSYLALRRQPVVTHG